MTILRMDDPSPKDEASPKRRAGLPLLLLFAAAFLSALASEVSPDLWTHITYGGCVLKRLGIPRHDLFTYTAEGARWVNHAWLSGVVLYVLHKAGGVAAVVLLRAFLFTCCCVLVYETARLMGAGTIAGGLSVVVCMAVMHCRMVTRPMNFSWALFALTCFLCRRHALRVRSSAGEWTGSRRFIILVTVLFLIWANLHVGFLVGLSVVLLGLLDAFVPGLPSGNLRPSRDPADAALVRGFGFALLLAGLATLANPFGWLTHLYPLIVKRSFPYLSQISEWAKPQWAPHLYPYWALALATLPAFALVRKEMGADGMLKSATLGVLSLTAVRHLEFFAIGAAPVVCAAFSRRYGARLAGWRFVSAPGASTRRAALGVVCFGIALAGYLYAGGQITLGANPWRLPVKGGEFLRRIPIPGRVFNTYTSGGYLTWVLFPDQRVFIDGRNDVTGREIADQYKRVLEGAPGWQSVLDRWRVDYLFIDNLSCTGCPHIFASGDWHTVYWDDVVAIAVRMNAQNADLIRQRSFHKSNPFLLAKTGLKPQDVAEVKRELEAKILEDPECASARLMMGRLLTMQGLYQQAIAELQANMRIEGENREALVTYGRILRVLKRHSEAIECFSKASRLPGKPKTAPLLEIGRTCHAMGNMAEAERCFRECVEREPGCEAGWILLHQLCVEQGRRDEAEKILRRSRTALGGPESRRD